MAYRLRRSENLSAGAHRVFREQIDLAVGQLTHNSNRDEAIHETRKSIKRIRALLALGDNNREDRHFRDLARLLSQLRDNKAVLEAFDELAATNATFAPLRSRIKTAPPADVKQIVTEVAKQLAARRADNFLVADPPLEETYRRGKKKFKRLTGKPPPEAFHSFRKVVKELDFQLRLVEPYLTPELKAETPAIRDLANLLGREHNVVVLEEYLAATIDTAADRFEVRAFSAFAATEIIGLRKRALHLAHQIYNRREGGFAADLSIVSQAAKRPAQSSGARKFAVA